MKSISHDFKKACPFSDFVFTVGCISSIKRFPETWGNGDTWQEEKSVPPMWYTKNDLGDMCHMMVIVAPVECGTDISQVSTIFYALI